MRAHARVRGDQGGAEPLVCGVCGDWRADLLAGDELPLLSIEFEISDEAADVPRA
ncbi:MAG TPA: hypothetical protein VEI03_08330 [Stellaceae bacterium]|nr:hypothetical protein [Stellaceae bacterium]